MRTLIGCVFVVFAFIACRSKPTSFEAQVAPAGRDAPRSDRKTAVPTAKEPIITIGGPTRARIASVNYPGRFVVLRFPIGAMPAVDRRFSVYRAGMKVGELRVSGPQYDNNTVADIVAGDCRVGDEARED